jgi:hypothetical protein
MSSAVCDILMYKFLLFVQYKGTSVVIIMPNFQYLEKRVKRDG